MQKLEYPYFWKQHLQKWAQGYMLLALPVGGYGAILMGGWGGFFKASAMVIFPISVLVSVRTWRSYSGTRKKLLEGVRGQLKRVDYFGVGVYGAIAVDAEAGEVAVCNVNRKTKVDTPIKFSKEVIRECETTTPGGSEIITLGKLSAADQIRKNEQNSALVVDALSKTGLFFELEDITHPRVNALLVSQEARDWMFVIRKLVDGSLETQPSPMLYPVKQASADDVLADLR